MKLLKIIRCGLFFSPLILLGLQVQASSYNSCRDLRLERVGDFHLVSWVLQNQNLQAYMKEKGGLKSIWPLARICSDSSRANGLLDITLAFSGPGAADVSWGWNYCQLDVVLKVGDVISFRERRCDSPMDH